MKQRIIPVILAFILIVTAIPLVQSSKAGVLTLDEKEINSHSSLLRGEVLDLGNNTNADVYFQYRKENKENWMNTTKQIKLSSSIFQEQITNLSSNSYYEYRAIGENIDGITYGATRGFTTEKSSGIFKIDSENTLTIITIIILFIISLLLISYGYNNLGSLIIVIEGFILLYNEVSLLLGVIMILIGFYTAFLDNKKGGNI